MEVILDEERLKQMFLAIIESTQFYLILFRFILWWLRPIFVDSINIKTYFVVKYLPEPDIVISVEAINKLGKLFKVMCPELDN